MALLDVLDAIVIRPNPKCAPPLELISQIACKASLDFDSSVMDKASSVKSAVELVYKPCGFAPFPSIIVPYEPFTETDEVSCQTENQVVTVNSYAQTILRDSVVVANETSVGTAKKIKRRNAASQTVASYEVASRSDADSTKSQRLSKVDCKFDVQLTNHADDYDSFVDLCQMFVPEIL